MLMKPDPSPGSSLTPRLTRRGFVKMGGALLVSFTFPGLPAIAAEVKPASETRQLASWLEIRQDNTILVRTGRTEIGTGMSAYYAQVIAEELSVQAEAITLIMGDTDKTPDGGYSAGFLYGAVNLRKVGAYTYQALLGLAAEKLRVPVATLTVTDGIVSGGGRSIRYGELVQDQQFDLKIPVSGAPAKVDPTSWNGIAGLDGLTVLGDPPTKPISQYKVVGKSHPMPGIPGKVTGKTQWSCDVTLPGMLHARMVRPPTLGSTLISVGAVDKMRFPNAQVITKKNLVAVLSPNEWEAVSAARSVASGTKWSEWSGLPGSEHLTQALRDYKWGAPSESKGNAADVTAALAHAPKTLSATYEQPYIKHAPIGPFVAVADVRSDGTATVWTHSANSQGLRAQIANTLSTPVEKVVVRWLDHAGQFGRTTFGGDGAEGDAAILSQLTGRPVRVQWTLQEDLAWSASSPGWVEDISCSLDDHGCVTALRSAFYSAQSNDARIVGALLAGMPCSQPKPGNWIATEWPYDKIPCRQEASVWDAEPGSGFAGSRIARAHHAHARTAAAELRARIADQRGGIVRRHRSYSVPALAHHRPAAHRHHPCHGQGGRMGATSFAAPGHAPYWNRARHRPRSIHHGPPELVLDGDRRGGSDSGYGRDTGDKVHHRCRLRQSHQPAATGTLHEERRCHGHQ